MSLTFKELGKLRKFVAGNLLSAGKLLERCVQVSVFAKALREGLDHFSKIVTVFYEVDNDFSDHYPNHSS